MDETALNRESEDLLPGFFPVKDTNEYIVGTTGAKVTAASSIVVVVEYCTTKRKELHGTTGVRAFYVGQRYCDFVLLIDATLAIEADNLDIDLYLHDKMVKASVSPCGLLELGVQQMEQAKLFQALMFNSLFGNTFDGVSDKKETNFHTFTEYFENTHGIVLRHPSQPLLAVKPNHKPHNLLSSKFRNEGNHVKTNGDTSHVNNGDSCVHMPPELLIPLNLSEDILRAFYLFPSLMHRIETLMLASQLRSEISYDDSNISSFLILEAITTLRCSEDFSMERLELLGDSVLKYAVSCHLFLESPDKDEGHLSSSRAAIISNAALYGLGMERKIQGYVRDAAFDPCRWLAPGQLSIHPVPCNCSVDSEVVTQDIHVLEDTPIVKIGQACDKGHRWMCSKTISDCVEAVIGAYYVGGGLRAAVAVLKWLGVDAEIEEELIVHTILSAPVKNCLPKIGVIGMLEAKLGYTFSLKGLLLEALTHPSQRESAERYSYQRLEFLGDAVLDILITRHLFNSHEDTDEGELTDLQSASVNNENFAQVAVKHKLHQFLQHSCRSLADQITEYENSLENSSMEKIELLSDAALRGPKVLGDIIESIAGAILIDAKLDLDVVWGVFRPLLSPIATPANLELPPFRELLELCSKNGYFLETNFTDGEKIEATLLVQLKEKLIVRQSCGKSKKDAKAHAASKLLEDIEKEGLLIPKNAGRMQQLQKQHGGTANRCNNVFDAMDTQPPTPTSGKKSDASKIIASLDKPVHVPVNTSRGGPRAALQGEGLLIPKNASRTQQLQKQGGTADLCNNLFDAMGTQLPTTTNGNKSYG
ncbi:hypothetical protein ACQ4PT_044679 [Festuca glaucescens]